MTPVNLGSAVRQTTLRSGHLCNVHGLFQPEGTSLCWAACMSMLYGFHCGGTYYPVMYVAQHYYDMDYAHGIPSTLEGTRGGLWVAHTLKYYLNMGNYIYHSYYDNGVLTYDTVYGYIHADYPIIAGCQGYVPDVFQPGSFLQVTGGHMSVFCGVTASNRVTVYDPIYGVCYATTYNHNGTDYLYYEYPSQGGYPRYMTQLAHIKYDVPRGE